MITPETAGSVSGILQIASCAVMIQPVAWPRTGQPRQQPHQISWLGWVCLYQVMTWASWARGAAGSLRIAAAKAAGTLTMVGLSLRRGVGSLRLTRLSRAASRVTVTSWPDFLVLCGTPAGGGARGATG